ncbi:Hypothetical predicted protein [Xyrichtys novacula]|uniref:Secreted protein n=1 Tax=Xyrichtys novacula TaxID=13765 RepID=A0AAV1FE68_XYRNO|nr:Hypothetical predicted protein [Xyrichtys novacula]
MVLISPGQRLLRLLLTASILDQLTTTFSSGAPINSGSLSAYRPAHRHTHTGTLTDSSPPNFSEVSSTFLRVVALFLFDEQRRQNSAAEVSAHSSTATREGRTLGDVSTSAQQRAGSR